MVALDRRRNERLSTEIPAFLRVANGQEGERTELVIKDLCSGGAYLQTNRRMAIGTEVIVQIRIPIGQSRKIETDGALYAAAGTVLRTDEKGMAVCFDRKYHMNLMEDI